MNWWRAHHGISNDVKIGIVAAKLGVTRADVGWTLVVLLDYASQNEADRGSLDGLEVDEIAAMSGVPVEKATQILEGLRDRKIITSNNRLANWEKRQFGGDYSTDRVRKLRKKRSETDETEPAFHETPGTQNRTEQNRTEQNTEEACASVPMKETPQNQEHTGDAFAGVWGRWPRKTGVDSAARDWLSHVNPGNEVAALACVGRYLDSDEVRRGAVRNLGSVAAGGTLKPGWIADCARDGWRSDWPRSRDSRRKSSVMESPPRHPPTPDEEIESCRWLIEHAEEEQASAEEIAGWERRIVELGANHATR